MLRELHVKNVAVVAEAAVEWEAGLNALTGETGAGKSIVIDALALLGGARASTDLIRAGAEGLSITGVFAPGGNGWREVLAEAGLEVEGDELLVRREVARSGRNRVFVNDQPATARLLVDLAPHLLRIHGQREELGLVAPDLQRLWLDKSGGAEAGALLGRVAQAYQRYELLAARLERASGDDRARRERIERLRFEVREIDAAAPAPGESEALRQEREGLRNREAIRAALTTAFALLQDDEGAAAERTARSREALAAIADWEARAAGWASELEEITIRLAEVGRDVGRRLDDIDGDPKRLDAVEDRLAALERLERRYGGSSAAVLAYRQEIGAELEALEGDNENRAELEEAVSAALEAYRVEAVELSAARGRWAERLVRAIEAELADLALAKAKLSVRLERRRRDTSPLRVDGVAVEPSAEGIDQVTFEFAANAGEEPRPLARVASGGELARLYLALLLAVGGGESARTTLVFDEIDAGVGGAQAAALGRKLQRLATGGQVLVVTHSPQVASFADAHFQVHKRERSGRTFTEVRSLGSEDRIDELGRMLSGSRLTETARASARELLGAAKRRR